MSRDNLYVRTAVRKKIINIKTSILRSLLYDNITDALAKKLEIIIMENTIL